MTINFTMSDEQKKLQYDVRAFSENVLDPVVADPDPSRASR
jgi:nitroalkane oxidase